MSPRRLGRAGAALVAASSLVASCASGTSSRAPGLAEGDADRPTIAETTPERSTPVLGGTPAPTIDPSTTTVTTPTTTSSSTSSTTTTTPSTSTTPTSSTITTAAPTTNAVAPVPPPERLDGGALPGPRFTSTASVFDRLAASNPAVSLTVLRDGDPAVALASGRTIAGSPATSDTPMVVASVTKLVTALAVIRFDTAGLRELDRPLPWDALGVAHHPAWNDVTARELLDHTSGMPVARTSWFDGPGTCSSHLPALVAAPPQSHRGEWRYSNGNYCALGLLVEGLSGSPLGEALASIVFDPVGATGTHLTTGGQQPGDVGYALGVERLSRLGGAGTLIASTDDVARVLAALSADDLAALRWPGVFVDQYGFGHTGTVDGAKACAWVFDDGRTVVSATVSGGRPQTGGELCDLVLPAVAGDLGMWAGEPSRTPPGGPPPT